LSATALTATTWYEQTGIAPPETAALSELAPACDIAIVGGGLAGMSLLRLLGEAGVSAVLFESGKIGSGASGRNGGFCSPGWAADDDKIARLVGSETARRLDALALGGVTWMRDRLRRPGYEAAEPKDGILIVSLSGKPPAKPEHGSELLVGDRLCEETNSLRYRFGWASDAGFQFHPLNFLRALARETISGGQTVIENARVDRIERQQGCFVLASGGKSIRAQKVVLATGGYGGRETGTLARILLPIRTYIGVTDPMPELLDAHIPSRYAIGDTRRAGNYYRRLADGRLLWGLGITAFGTLDVEAVRRMVRKDLGKIYPALARDMDRAGIGIDTAWAGNMGYARHFMPYVRETEPGLFTIAGFGGHGMNTAPAAAKALCQAMMGETEALAPFAALPKQATFGSIGLVAAEASYRWRQINDRLAEALT
jgi:gamma-glutamylputrescine oxidase